MSSLLCVLALLTFGRSLCFKQHAHRRHSQRGDFKRYTIAFCLNFLLRAGAQYHTMIRCHIVHLGDAPFTPDDCFFAFATCVHVTCDPTPLCLHGHNILFWFLTLFIFSFLVSNDSF